MKPGPWSLDGTVYRAASGNVCLVWHDGVYTFDGGRWRRASVRRV
jgi:hypothetical protein